MERVAVIDETWDLLRILLRLMIYPKLERFEGVPIKMEMKRRASRQRCPLNQEVNSLERGSASSREFACTMLRLRFVVKESHADGALQRGATGGLLVLAALQVQGNKICASICFNIPQYASKYWPVWFSRVQCRLQCYSALFKAIRCCSAYSRVVLVLSLFSLPSRLMMRLLGPVEA